MIKERTYNRVRVSRSDGTFYSIVEVTVPDVQKVEFHKGIRENREWVFADAAHLRTLRALHKGIQHPTFILWDAYGHGLTYKEFVPSQYQDGTVHVSKNSLITQHLRDLLKSYNYEIADGVLRVKQLDSEGSKFTQGLLDNLYAEERIRVIQPTPTVDMHTIYRQLDPMADLMAIGNLGFPSSYARTGKYQVVFNTSFFLFEDGDFQSPFSLYGDAYNLQIRDGEIESPPLHCRSTLLWDNQGRVTLKELSLAELTLQALGHTWDLAEETVYTRYTTVPESGKTLTKTPFRQGYVDFVLIDCAIVGYRYGGGIEIPQNGFVLSLPEAAIPRGALPNKVRYFLKGQTAYHTAIQCGPGLINNGTITLGSETLVQEQFFQRRYEDGHMIDSGVVPTDYAPDIDKTRAARTAIGVSATGQLKILVVEAVNKGMDESYGESYGVTLQELAAIAQERGYKYALNLDGGGSSTICYQFGQLTRGADRRGLPGVMYERMVPSVGVVHGK